MVTPAPKMRPGTYLGLALQEKGVERELLDSNRLARESVMIRRFTSWPIHFDKEYDPESSLSHDLTYLFEARSVAGDACTSGAYLETMKGLNCQLSMLGVEGLTKHVSKYQTRFLSFRPRKGEGNFRKFQVKFQKFQWKVSRMTYT